MRAGAGRGESVGRRGRHRVTRRRGTHPDALGGLRPAHFLPARARRPPISAWIGRRWTRGDAIGLGLPDVRGRGPGRELGRHGAVRPFPLRDAAELGFEAARLGGSVPREAVAGEWGVGDYAGIRARLRCCHCLPGKVSQGPCQPLFFTFKILGYICVCMCRVSVRGQLGLSFHVGLGDRT